MDKANIENREKERIPAKIKVRFYCCNRINDGMVMNISEKGMFITIEELCFPFDSHFEMILYAGEVMFRSPVNLIRVEMSPDHGDGIGVELLNPSPQYLNLVATLRSA